ncbi:hypothetical protein TNCV_935431 [Trichonephila clavipes]|nr:hypothetical protein TNCV_935431 [Trichonephila clavipes]
MAQGTRNTCDLKTPFQTTTPRQPQFSEPRKLNKHKNLYTVLLKLNLITQTINLMDLSAYAYSIGFYWGLRKTPPLATSVLTTTPHQQEDSDPTQQCVLYHYLQTISLQRLIVFWVCEKRCLHTTTPRQQQSSQPQKIYQASVDGRT